MGTNSKFTSIAQLHDFVHAMNSHAFEDPNVQKLIHSTNLHYEVVINEEFFADSFLMFGHKFKAPTITLCKYMSSEKIGLRVWAATMSQPEINSFRLKGPFGVTNVIDEQMGFITPISIAPHWVNHLRNFFEHISNVFIRFLQRIENYSKF